MKQTKVISKFDLQFKFDSLSEFKEYLKNLSYKSFKTRKGISYINMSNTIDIEVSSFYDTNNEKVGLPYAFTLGINGHSYLGRSKEDLLNILSFIIDTFQLSKDKRMIFYIHNLGYEFQFFMKWFNWISVFAIDSRSPVYACSLDGIEFRCSYLLSGYSLENVAKNLTSFKLEKKKGDLDYRKIRSPKTPLTNLEIGYILYDGLIVMCYIQEQIESHKNKITNIPLTKTGEVRKYCRNMTLYNGGGSHKNTGRSFNKYHYFISNVRISSINEYKQLKRAFAGGFTHANPLIVGNVVKNAHSYDFTSSYPAVMCLEKYPCTSGKLITIKSKEDFLNKLKIYCCLFDITFINIESTIHYENYISSSHCYVLKDSTLSNGRVIKASELSMTITEQDYNIISKTYQWDHMKIKNFRIYKKDYLPKEFIYAILKLYSDKTTLKGVEGKEAEYLHAKENVNSCYGMCVTDICRKENKFNVEKQMWEESSDDIDYEKLLEKYNNDKRRFLCYQWGIWVTSFARHNLWTGILEYKEHYLYSDTDSIKGIHKKDHIQFIEEYNNRIFTKIKQVCNYYQLDESLFSPKTIEGKIKTLGLWDFEETFDFKTLGAKRYIIKDEKGYHMTIAGLNKKTALAYLESQGDVFEQFKEGMYIPPTYKDAQGQIQAGTGKNTHTYIDDVREGVIRDYKGKLYKYKVESCVHMEEADYTLSLANDFVDLLLRIQRKEYN